MLFPILLYGIPASLLLSAIIVGMGLVNPRLMLRSYPKDVRAAVPPQTDQEKRQTLYWSIPFWLCLLSFPVAAALSTKGAQGNAVEIFLSAAGTIFLFNLVDWLILDWLIVCTITPRFMVLSGTEGMAGYKNYGMHFRGFLIGTGLAAVIGFLTTIILIFF
ncbi:hypothetical protein [Ktedonospora formicarum]|uniref:hypothetical protein n=1 Tax=Ktedonospora formicarum TaxID=2778364 RepID=UPI001C687D63|nr:hypothetical protein [Ktedonospora formicarum]